MIKRDKIIKQIENIPNGRFFRIHYMSPMKVLAEYVNRGVSIIKIVETTSRTGIKYGNIKGVVSTYSDQYVPKKPSSWEWVIKNKIKYNTNTKREYLCLYPIVSKKSHSKVKYLVYNNECGESFITTDLDKIKHYLQPSQLTKSTGGGKTINIQLDNILYIGG